MHGARIEVLCRAARVPRGGASMCAACLPPCFELRQPKEHGVVSYAHYHKTVRLERDMAVALASMQTPRCLQPLQLAR